MAVEPTPINPLGRLMSRLESHLNPEGKIVSRSDRIVNKINTKTTIADNDLVQLRTQLRIKSGENTKETLQDELIVRLIAYSRQNFHETKDRKYDFEKEKKEIIAILHLLQRNHVHLPTGFGKSTIVLPVATIIHALTEGESPILATVNSNLKADLTHSLQKTMVALPKELQPTVENVEKTTDTTTFGESIWRSRIKSDSYINPFTKTCARPTIRLTDDRTLVFETITDPFCWKHLPTVYFDEAHVPFDRGSPYVTTKDAPLSEMAKEDCRNQWTVIQAIATNLTTEHFDNIKGQFTLNRAGYAIVEQAITSLGLQALENPVFRRWLENQKKDDAGDDTGDETGLMTLGYTLANDLALVKNYKCGVHYSYDQDNQLIVRDPYLGQLLKTHHFDPYVELAIRSRDNQYRDLNLGTASAGQITHFPSFITQILGGNIRTTSGTLLFGDLQTGKAKKSAFAQFLESHTQGKVVEVDWRVKSLPRPEIFDDTTSTINSLVARLGEIDAQTTDRKPTLIQCWDEEEGKALQLALQARFPERVQLVDGDTSDEKVASISRQMEKNHKSAQFVISTGKIGLGTDIKRPDIRVAVYNMPFSRLQIWQAFGRRRALDSLSDDLLWYVATPSLQKFVDLLDSDVPFVQRTLGHVRSFDEIKTALESDQTAICLEALDYLYDKYEKKMRLDSEFVGAVDAMYTNHLLPAAYGVLEEELHKYILQHPSLFSVNLPERERILRLLIPNGATWNTVDQAAKLIGAVVGIPETIYNDIYRIASHISGATSTEDLLYKTLLQLGKELPGRMTGWINDQLANQETLEKYDEVFTVAEGWILPSIQDRSPQLFFGYTPQKINASGEITPFDATDFGIGWKGQRFQPVPDRTIDDFPQYTGFGYVQFNGSSKKELVIKHQNYYWLVRTDKNQPVVLNPDEVIYQIPTSFDFDPTKDLKLFVRCQG